MEQVVSAIKKGLHKTNKQALLNQTWGDFEDNCLNRKVFIWGMSMVAEVIFDQQKCIKIEGVIDNSHRKQGHLVSDYINCPKDVGELQVTDKLILWKYDVSQIVVLIASLKYYEEIINDLEGMGIANYFSLLHMEYNRFKDCPDLMEEEINDLGTYMGEVISKHNIQNNKIVIYSAGIYGNHEKYIVEQLLKYRDDLDIVYRIDNVDVKLPKGVRGIFGGKTRQIAFELATAKIWITSTMMPKGIKKREGQVYIHVKHWASITLKKFYLDAPSVKNHPGNEVWWKENADMMDFIIVGSKIDEESCRRGLSEKAKMLHFGSPRSDILFQSTDVKKKVCKFYRMDENKPILLFAPTYRFKNIDFGGGHVVGEIEINYGQLRNILMKRFGIEWNIVLRLHPMIKMKGKELADKEGIIDASEYDDSQELVAACDILVSDYSSIMFEPAFVKKPVFLFAPDRESYIDHEYEFLMDYDSLPFPIATSNEELVDHILNFNQEKYEIQVSEFLDTYGVHEDGHASERTAEFILKVMH